MTTVEHATAHTAGTGAVSATGLLRSEWIKLRTVRSTLWCYGLVIVFVIGVAVLIASLADFHGQAFADVTGSSGTGPVTGSVARSLVVGLTTGGLNLAVLIVAVLGALIITGEYSTGMIRSTFAAAPRRTGALAGKGTVLGVSTFVATAIGIWLAALATWPILNHRQVEDQLGDPSVFWPLFGGALYVTMIALLAFAFGVIVRSTAGAIATVLGLLLVAPIIVQLIAGLTHANWVSNIGTILPGAAGSHLFSYQGGSPFDGPPSDGWSFGAGIGFLVLLAWIVVVSAVAWLRVKKRDA